MTYLVNFAPDDSNGMKFFLLNRRAFEQHYECSRDSGIDKKNINNNYLCIVLDACPDGAARRTTHYIWGRLDGLLCLQQLQQLHPARAANSLVITIRPVFICISSG